MGGEYAGEFDWDEGEEDRERVGEEGGGGDDDADDDGDAGDEETEEGGGEDFFIQHMENLNEEMWKEMTKKSQLRGR